MTFVLEAVRTRRGSALLLHFGMANSTPSRILIDCGADGSYRADLRPRLMQLCPDPSRPLALRLILATQMDASHLGEMALMFQDVQDGRIPVQAEALWINPPGGGPEALASILEVADRLGLSLNAPFDPPYIRADTKTFPQGDGLSIEVLGPNGAPKAGTQSAPILLMRKGDQSMLIAGNAPGAVIVDALIRAGYLDPDEATAFDDPFHVNLMAVTQHGDTTHMDQRFFRQVTADSYLFAGHPRYGNPEVAMLRAISAARADDDFNIYFTITARVAGACPEKRAVLDWVAEDMPGGCVAIFREDVPERYSTLVELPA